MKLSADAPFVNLKILHTKIRSVDQRNCLISRIMPFTEFSADRDGALRRRRPAALVREHGGAERQATESNWQGAAPTPFVPPAAPLRAGTAQRAIPTSASVNGIIPSIRQRLE